MATLHGLEDPEVQQLITKQNAGRFDPNVDRNMLRDPDRLIYIFSISQRAFVVDRPPLFLKLHLRACPADERYVKVTHIPDPLMQAVHDTERARRRGEANDGMLCAIELLNPNNPTYDPDYNPPPELAAQLNSSRGCNLFAQGLFISLSETPSEAEIDRAYARREAYYKALVAQADSLEAVDRKELEEFIKGEDGTDLRLALNYFGETRTYHRPMVPTIPCPNCGETIKKNAAFHKSEALGAVCVLDWHKAVDAGVKQKSDVPDDKRWWLAEKAEKTPAAAKPAKASKPAKAK